MKKLMIFLLLLVSLIGINSFCYAVKNSDFDSDIYLNVFSNNIYPITVINPNAESNPVGAYYPGFRGGNQLIIYTPEFGKRTGTNEFGQEVIVENGKAVSFSGSNSFIPQGGFVISAHGRAKKWLMKSIVIGANLKLITDPKSNVQYLHSEVTPKSYIFQASYKIDKLEQLKKSLMRKTQENYLCEKTDDLLKLAKQHADEARKSLNINDYASVKKYSNLAIKFADEAIYNLIPAVEGEFHGIWVRPVEKNREEVAKTLDKIADSGIDNIFLETYYQGYTIFPSETLKKYGVAEQREEFKGWNPLLIWVEEAHKRNIKVHVWFQTFYAGNEDISKNKKHVLSVYPNWGNIQKRDYKNNKPTASTSEHNGYFLDPANPMVQNYLLDLLNEIATKYNVDGVNIDYIRYPASLASNFPNYVESTWGYTLYARSKFLENYNVDPVELTPEHPLWEKWEDYRKESVNRFVSKLKLIKNKRDIEISAVIFPDAEESSVKKLQDWKVWADNAYIDSFTPLILGSGEAVIDDYISSIENKTNGEVKVYAGLFQPFIGASPVDMLYQLNSARSEGADGIILFDYAHFSDKYKEALKARVLNK